MLPGFLTDYLTAQKNLSSNTMSSYRDTFVLLFRFMQHSKGILPEQLKNLADSFTKAGAAGDKGIDTAFLAQYRRTFRNP